MVHITLHIIYGGCIFGVSDMSDYVCYACRRPMRVKSGTAICCQMCGGRIAIKVKRVARSVKAV